MTARPNAPTLGEIMAAGMMPGPRKPRKPAAPKLARAETVAALAAEVVALAGGGYAVPSSQGGKLYRVTPQGPDGLLTCDCPAGSHGTRCKHRDAVHAVIRQAEHDATKAKQAAAQARDAAMVVADIDPAERYIARDRAAAAARGRQPWVEEV